MDESLTKLSNTLEKYSKRQEEKRKAEIAVMKAEMQQIKEIIRDKLGVEVWV